MGLRVNVVAFYVVAIPAASFFGFILHWGVEGLYAGLILGATVQAIGYSVHLRKVDWQAEAAIAATRVEEVASGAEKLPETQ